MARDDLTTSALARFAKLGGLAGRVGVSMLGARALDLALGETEGRRSSEALIRNAARVVETLGQLKGGAMKIGQMLSLHEGLMPPEVAAVLRTLQREAPRVPFEVMQYEVRREVRDFDRVFASLEPEAFAAASIGQVHRGRLRDGREVAVKIQYPEIEHVVRADLKNLKRVLQGLFSLVSSADFEPAWREVRDRLLEELDYTREAANQREMAALHAAAPEIVVPRVIEEASTRTVLTTEYLPGIPPERACSEEFSRELRDAWGRALFCFLMRGLYEHRLLHADPNLSNFAFLRDGRIVVYDFGCLKRVPERLARGFARLSLAAVERRRADVPGILLEMGLHLEDGSPLPRDLTDPYVELVETVYREAPPYLFGEDPGIYDRMLELGLQNWSRAGDVRFPEDVVFVNRTLSGHFGNLSKLGATAPWRDLIRSYVRVYVETGPP